jgi:hypothetical protein
VTPPAREALVRTLVTRSILAGLLTVGCAAPALRPVQEDHGQRFAGPGFSVEAPPGTDWYVVPPAPGRIHFAKKGGAGHVSSIYAAVWVTDVDERPTRAEILVPFKERAIEQLRRQELDYVIVLRDLKVNRAPGAECISWEQEEEQRNHPIPPSARMSW